MREIEVKIKLTPEQTDKLTAWLAENMEPTGETSQTEYYLDNPEQSFLFQHKLGYLDASDYFRVRFEGDAGSVCLKRFRIDPETSASENLDEVEFDVSNAEEALKLLAVLGFTSQTKVAKHRQKFANDNFEIVLDSVEGLGDFAEIEVIHDGSVEYADGVERIYKLLREIGITEFSECKRGYVSMLWNPGYEFGEVKQI